MIFMLIARNIIVLFLMLASILGIVFGAYLPFEKSQRFIESLKTSRSMKTVEEFQQNFKSVLDYYSPVGQEEAIKFYADDIFGLIQKQPEDIAHVLAQFMTPYLLEHAYDLRLVLLRAQMYDILYRRFERAEDADMAKQAYESAMLLGPKMPRVLYSAIDFYLLTGDKGRAKTIGETILSYWPTDEGVRKIVSSL